MGIHKITLGDEGVSDIGYLVDQHIESLKKDLKSTEDVFGDSERVYWKARIEEMKSEVTKYKAYHQIIKSADSMVLTHNVNPLAGQGVMK